MNFFYSLHRFRIHILFFLVGILFLIEAFHIFSTENLDHSKVLLLGFVIFLVSYAFITLKVTKEKQEQMEIKEFQKKAKEGPKEEYDHHKFQETIEYLTKFTTSELQSAIHEVIFKTALVMNIDRVGVWLQSDAQSKLTCSGIYVLSSSTFINNFELSSDDFPHYFEAISDSPFLIFTPDLENEIYQEFSSYFEAFNIISKIDFPILFENELLGVLSYEETRGYREWHLEDFHYGQTIASIIAVLIGQSTRKIAEKGVLESEERLRLLTQNSIDGIVTINDKQEIIAWNFGAEKMFGYKEVEMLEKELKSIFLEGELKQNMQISQKPLELKGRHKNGHLFPVEISQTRWNRKELYFDTIIIRDITERKENEKQLIKNMREAKAANEAKNKFLATISHELRTPLNAILGFNQCLLMEMDGTINQKQRQALEKIEKSSFHLLTLINDLLDWSKIEAKKMELEIMSYNIVEIVKSCCEEMQPIAEKKNLGFYFSTNAPIILLRVDLLRMRQVFLNLLDNAIKFTHSGSVHISILNEPEQVVIQVEDTGIGLSKEEKRRIFHPFSQANSSITRKYGGTGLGLVISKKIVELHGGIISIESEKGKGSIFIVTIFKDH